MLKALMKVLLFETWRKTMLWAYAKNWGSSWQHLSCIWAVIGWEVIQWEKTWEKKGISGNRNLHCLDRLQGVLGVLSHSLLRMSWKWLRAVKKHRAKRQEMACYKNMGVQLSPAPSHFLGIPLQAHCLPLFRPLSPVLVHTGWKQTTKPTWRNGFQALCLVKGGYTSQWDHQLKFTVWVHFSR